MKIAAHDPIVDVTALLGVAAGIGMLLPACFIPELALLAVPACALLFPSMMAGMR